MGMVRKSQLQVSPKPNSIEKEIQIVLDEILDEVAKKPLPINLSTSKQRRGAAERKSYSNSFKMSVINACKRKRVTDQDIAVQFSIDKSLI